MVFFTCNACGESLKRAQVDKHVNMCRGCQALSCIDCGKDFWGDDYKNHIKCISEDQKYGGKGYEAKSKKGDVKQQQWIQRIHAVMNKPGISPKLKNILNQFSSYDNIPRKKAKFQNWMKNSLRITNPSLQDEVWEIFSAATSNGPEASKQNGAPEEAKTEVQTESNGSQEHSGSSEMPVPKKNKKLNKQERKEARQEKNGKVKKGTNNNTTGEQQDGTEKIKDKKRKRACKEEKNGDQDAGDKAPTKRRKKSKEQSSDDDQTADSAEAQTTDETEEQEASRGKFNWKGTIKAVLRQSPDHELSVKKLRKKVLSAYYSFSGDSNFKSEEQLLSLFNKKISGNPKFKVLKEKVTLVK